MNILRRHAGRVLLAGLVIALSTPASAASLIARLPDGRKIHFECSGKGSPTVLLESGWGADAGAWFRVRPDIAKTQRVCAYDRAGAGSSDPGPYPRDGRAIAADLDAGLRAGRIKGPFVIVGHSAGGLYARLFADRRARDVVGMVLVDPTVEHQEQRLGARYGIGAGSVRGLVEATTRCLQAARERTLPSTDPALKRCSFSRRPREPDAAAKARAARMLRPATWATQASELVTLATTTSQAIDAGRRSYGDMPLIVLTAGRTFTGEPAQFWASMHREVAARSREGRTRIVDSGHLMMIDRPNAVITAIREVIASAR